MTSAQWIGLLKTGVIPGAVTLVVLIALWRPWRREYVTPRYPIPIAVAIGFLVGAVLIAGWSGSPDLGGQVRALFGGSTPLWQAIQNLWEGVWHGVWALDPTKRMGQYGLIALLGAALVARLPESESLGWLLVRLILQLGTVGAAAAFLLMPRIRLAWTPAESLAAVAGLSVVGVIWWNAIGAAALRRPDASVVWTLAGVSAASAATLFPTGSASLSQQAVMLAVVLAVCGMGAIVRPDLVDTRAIGAVPSVLFVVLWGAGMFYSDERIPVASLVLLGLGPLLVWVVLAPGIEGWGGWQAGVVQTALAFVVVGSAGAVAATAVRARGAEANPGEIGVVEQPGAQETVTQPEAGEQPMLNGRWLFEDDETGKVP